MRWLPLAAAALGSWLILSGIAHTIGVWNVAQDGRPYDLRYASLVGLGWTLMFAGALQLGAAWGLRTMQRWAVALSAATGLFVVVHIIILIPILPAIGLLLAHLAHLGLLAYAAQSQRRTRAR